MKKEPLEQKLKNNMLYETAKEIEIKAYKEFAERVEQTLAMLNAAEIAGVSREHDNRYFYESPMAWKEGSITARRKQSQLL